MMGNLPTSQTNMTVPNQIGNIPAHLQDTYSRRHEFDEPLEEETGFDPLKIFFYMLQYRWLIVGCMVTSIICAIIFTFLQTPMYSATTKVEILTSSAKVFQDLEVVGQSNDARDYETAREKMLSRDLARRVVFNLGLTDNAQFLDPTPTFSFVNLFSRIFGVDSKPDISDQTPEERQRNAVDLLQKNVSVNLLRNTSILSVSYSHAQPDLTHKITNNIAKSYIDQSVDKKSETSELARQFIEEQVIDTKSKLQESEKALLGYAQQVGITVTGDDVSLIAANISEINKALTDAVQERLDAERLDQQTLSGQAATLPDVFTSESIQKNKLVIAELSASYQEKLGTLKPGFPEMRRLRAQINEVKKQVNNEISAIARSTRIKFDQAKSKEISLKQELVDLEKQQAEFQQKNIQYTIFKREVDSNRKQYESLIGKLSDVGVGSEIKSSNASIIDLAIIPLRPYSPRMLINLIASIGLFSLIAATLIYILELMNNTFAIPDQIEQELKIPVLGIIPFVDNPMDDDEPVSQFSEAYRTLRTSVQFTGTERTLKTILVTSTEPSEAKTTTSFKIAEGYAALGRKVLIIDADLRKPRMHKMFDLENGMGLSNLLTNVVKEKSVGEIFRQTNNPNIHLLSAGTIPPNPTDLLVSNKMGLTIHFSAKKYDLVVIDSPPVMGLSDAPLLSRMVDATLYVVSSKQVTRKAAKNAIGRLRAAGANIIGCALTKFDIERLAYNYGYRYMQSNYYTYSNEEQQKPFLENLMGSMDDRKGKETTSNNSIFSYFSRWRSNSS